MIELNQKVEIIAEAGVNHNGSLPLAKEMIDVAKEAGADVIKFQTAQVDQVVIRNAPKADYQIKNTGTNESQLEMLQRLHFKAEGYQELLSYSQKRGITFLSTPFDVKSVELLFKLGVDRFKIPSGEITHGNLLLKVAETKLPILLSTGMSTIEEIEAALKVLAFGLLYGSQKAPSPAHFTEAFKSQEGQRLLKEKVVLLHCTTEYPAPLPEVHLKAMDVMHEVFGLRIGYSDHTEGIVVPIAAAARGASVIEKHFTLDKNMEGPDHKASLEPEELRQMVRGIREVEVALGKRMKDVTPSEEKNRAIARKSLIATKHISKGEKFTTENLTAKRPGTGVTPMKYWDYLDTTAKRDYEEDEIIE